MSQAANADTATRSYISANVVRGNLENPLTPARRRWMTGRLEATKRLQQYEADQAILKFRGVLAAGDPRHVFEVQPNDLSQVGGVLFNDGTVHLFDRSRQMHVEYAREYGKPNIMSGASGGDEGWGFYINDGEFARWCLPAEYEEAVREVIWGKQNVPSPTKSVTLETRIETAVGVERETRLRVYPGWTVRQYTDGTYDAINRTGRTLDQADSFYAAVALVRHASKVGAANVTSCPQTTTSAKPRWGCTAAEFTSYLASLASAEGIRPSRLTWMDLERMGGGEVYRMKSASSVKSFPDSPVWVSSVRKAMKIMRGF
jgi:hypothetical protein